MKNKIVGLVRFFLFVFCCFYSHISFADGMLASPSGGNVFETDQKAVIFYENGIEHLVVATSFIGSSGVEDFAWIVPTPNKPEVSKSSVKLFENLNELTQSDFEAETYTMDSKIKARSSVSGVQVVESKTIEYYDIVVLKAGDEDALYTWLNEKNYQFPQSGKGVIDEYIKNGWFFTAIKINSDYSQSLVEKKIIQGTAFPLQLIFKTEKPVYPLKISSVIGEDDDSPVNEISYVKGKKGVAAQIDSDKMLSSDRVLNFDSNGGELKFSLKKRSSDPVGDLVNIIEMGEQLGKRGFYLKNNYKNVFSFQLYTDYSIEYFELDLGSDFRENQWQDYEIVWKQDFASQNNSKVEFYIDGILRIPKRIFGKKASDFHRFGKGVSEINIGGTSNYLRVSSGQGMKRNSFYFGLKNERDLFIDNLSVKSNVSGNSFFVDFENNLKIVDSLEDDKVLRIFSNNQVSLNSLDAPTDMGILIYLISDKQLDIPSFDLKYRGILKGSDVSELAFVNTNDTWIKLNKDDQYFLTKFFRRMDVLDMSDDIYPREVKSTDAFPVSYENRKLMVIFLVVLSSLFVLGVVAVLVKFVNKGK